MRDHRVEARIVDEDQLAVRITLDQADILPDLDRYRALFEFGIEPGIGLFGPAGFCETLHGEGRGVVEMRRIGGVEMMRDGGLIGKSRELRIIDIDAEKLETIRTGLIDKGRIGDIDVHM